MPHIAQRRVKLSGRWYEPGEEIPDDVPLGRLAGMVRYVARSADAGGGDELERLKAELAAAQAKLEEFGVPAPAPPLDPAEHTVADVLAHVDRYPQDLQRVRDAEADGKARKTLLADLDERLADAGIDDLGPTVHTDGPDIVIDPPSSQVAGDYLAGDQDGTAGGE